MKKFMDEEFLLGSDCARKLYHDYAEHMPIVDYHCHINPLDIAENKQYQTITEVWLGGDHYKWRLMRAGGVPEAEITGALQSDPYRVFERYAQVLPRAVGNPVYHWTHLELKRYFGIDEQLNAATARDIYARCNERLAQEDMRVRGLIGKADVRLICTTDDPVDDLRWHRQIADDPTCRVKVLPAFRPDRALNIDKPGFVEYIAALGRAVGNEIRTIKSLRRALEERIDFFHAMGCRAADHGLDFGVYAEAGDTELNNILQKAFEHSPITRSEAEKFRTALLCCVAQKYAEHGWVMQIHFGCNRNNNARFFEMLGPDTGFDAINDDSRPDKLTQLFNRISSEGHLPRTILYSLNPNDSEVLVSIAGCFMADAECPGKVQVGSAWWFNDSKSGMEKQLRDFANGSLLGNFVGMLTDSRSFLSYTRHEYFRRILCNFLGGLVENGEYPEDYALLGGLVQDICYNNAVRFFGFEI